LTALFRTIRNLFLFACVLVAGFAVIAYVSGWIEVRRDVQHDKAVIEIETGKAKEAAREAVVKSRDLAQEAGSKIDRFAKQHTSTSPRSEPGQNGVAVPEKSPEPEQPRNAAGDTGTQRR
jgi:hypothetical protein